MLVVYDVKGAAAFCVFALAFSRGACQTPPQADLSQFSIEDLMKVEVTSVTKRPQPLLKAAAAIFVITQEDIHRSGARTIPDLFRMVPGVDVAQIDSSHVAVSVRGFNSVFANKVLLLIDGRSVYSNTFSGVFWDEVDVPLEDIDRIEVIRGPGGTLWGANAVNGVINIITKPASATKGGLVTAGGGNRDIEGLAQYGGDVGSKGSYRAFAKYVDDRKSTSTPAFNADDGAHRLHGGFRSDWSLSPRDSLTVSGDFQTIHESGTTTAVLTGTGFQPYLGTFVRQIDDVSGNVLARWEHTLESGSQTSLQTSYSSVRRNGQAGTTDANDTLDFEFTWALAPKHRNHIIWGVDFRTIFDSVHTVASYGTALIPRDRTDQLFSAFVQDSIEINRSVVLTLGSKIEHNSYTGMEVEPSAQLVWVPSESSAVWGSVSRAVRQPSRVDTDVLGNGTVAQTPFGIAVISLAGNPNIKAESLYDFELGYRTRAGNRFSVDLASFLSYYRNLETIEPEAPILPTLSTPWFTIPSRYVNLGSARTYGAEISANWNVTHRWELRPGYSLLRMAFYREPQSSDSAILVTPGNSPAHQVQLRSLVQVTRNVNWDSSVKYVSALTNLNVPGYARVDSRVGWKLGERTEISVVGQNLLSPRHREFLDLSGGYPGTPIMRSVFVKLEWQF